MKENISAATNERRSVINDSPPAINRYEFDNNSFVVEPIFKNDNAETLFSILLRIMTHI